MKNNKFEMEIQVMFDIQVMLPKFETIEKMEEERELRISHLNEHSTIESMRLAKTIENCSYDEPCKNCACPICCRNNRLKLINRASNLATKNHDWLIVTIVLYDQSFTDDRLEGYSIKNAQLRLRKWMDRCQIEGPVIGGFEMDFHSEDGMWYPHFHLLLRDQPSNKKLASMIKGICKPARKRERIPRPIMFQQLKNKHEQISYIFKYMWQRVEIVKKKSIQDKERHKKFRLLPHQFTGGLLKISTVNFSTLTFTYKCRALLSKK